jgi:hypothetical protein
MISQHCGYAAVPTLRLCVFAGVPPTSPQNKKQRETMWEIGALDFRVNFIDDPVPRVSHAPVI